VAKLVVIRGPSGAGKSTLARAVAAATARPLAVVDRDHYMFMFNRWPDAPDQELIHRVILFCLERDIDVVFEGNFRIETHERLLEELFAAHPVDNFTFYLDVSLEETLRRHEGRPQRITAEKMQELYPVTTPLHDPTEHFIPETASIEQAAQIVLMVARL
jgi:thymidylate kinase